MAFYCPTPSHPKPIFDVIMFSFFCCCCCIPVTWNSGAQLVGDFALQGISGNVKRHFVMTAGGCYWHLMGC